MAGFIKKKKIVAEHGLCFEALCLAEPGGTVQYPYAIPQEAYETGRVFGPYNKVILLTIDTCILNKHK